MAIENDEHNNFCPVCENNCEKFLGFGQPERKNALCPKCRSLERHRLLWLYLKNRTSFFDESLRVLHVAPEKVLREKFKTLKNIQYISADLDSPYADLKTDITNIEWDDNYFDVIICYHVLEHIPDDTKAMRELLRVMSKTGWAILQVPIRVDLEKTIEDPTISTPEARLAAYGQSDHVRIYGRDYEGKLKNAGFDVKIDRYISTFSSKKLLKYGLKHNEDIFLCNKT